MKVSTQPLYKRTTGGGRDWTLEEKKEEKESIMALIRWCLITVAICSLVFVSGGGQELPATPGNPLLPANRTVTVNGTLMAPPPPSSPPPPLASSDDTLAELKREVGSLKKMVSGLQITLAVATIISTVINAVINGFILLRGDKSADKISAAILAVKSSPAPANDGQVAAA